MGFWAIFIFPVLELPLFAGNQQKGFDVAVDKPRLLVAPLTFIVGLKGASGSIMS